jgi:hypothetical protein
LSKIAQDAEYEVNNALKSFLGRNLTQVTSLSGITGGRHGAAVVFDQGKRITPIRLNEPRCGVLIRFSDPRLDRGLQDRIGRDLRAMYAQLLREPISDRILDLVARLGRTPRRSIQ